MNKRMILFAKIVLVIAILNFLILRFLDSGTPNAAIIFLASTISFIFFNYPLYHYAYVKKKNKKIKLWAKILTFVIPFFILLAVYLETGSNFTIIGYLGNNIIPFAKDVLVFIPTYYYAWVEKT